MWKQYYSVRYRQPQYYPKYSARSHISTESYAILFCSLILFLNNLIPPDFRFKMPVGLWKHMPDEQFIITVNVNETTGINWKNYKFRKGELYERLRTL